METNDLSPEAAQAIHKTKSAQQAIELARAIEIERAVEQTALKTKEALLEGLKEVFGESDSENPQQMKVLVRRIPILCTNVAEMHSDLGEIKTSISGLPYIQSDLKWLKIILGAIGVAILGAIATALIAKII